MLAIINDPEKRKKLVVYINPPYAEVSSKDIKGKVGVNLTKVHNQYSHVLGTAGRELFAQFLIRIFAEVNGCYFAEFSTLKILTGSAFIDFRNFMKAKLEKCFVAPADTFDNVKGKFPIGFKVWNSSNNEGFTFIDSDVYDESGILAQRKLFQPYEKCQFINKWISLYKISESDAIGFMDGINGNDFQHNSIVYILDSKAQIPNPRGIWVNRTNLIAVAIYNAIRHCIEHTWLNHNDQFLTPNYSWQIDTLF